MELKMLAGFSAIATCSLIFWRLLGKNFGKVQQKVRRFFLFTLIVSFVFPYIKIAEYVKNTLLEELDLNYLLGELFGQFKGTDWADGLLTTFFFFLYMTIVVIWWLKEKKESKKDDEKKEDKPFKIEARIGNIQGPVEQDKKG